MLTLASHSGGCRSYCSQARILISDTEFFWDDSLLFSGTHLLDGTRDSTGQLLMTQLECSQFSQSLGKWVLLQREPNEHRSSGFLTRLTRMMEQFIISPGSFSESPGLWLLISESFVQLVCRQYNFLAYCLIESCSSLADRITGCM